MYYVFTTITAACRPVLHCFRIKVIVSNWLSFTFTLHVWIKILRRYSNRFFNSGYQLVGPASRRLNYYNVITYLLPQLNTVIIMTSYRIGICPIMWKRDIIHKTGSTITLSLTSSSKERAAATANIYETSWSLDTSFCDTLEDRHTHIHTDRHTDRNTLHPSRRELTIFSLLLIDVVWV